MNVVYRNRFRRDLKKIHDQAVRDAVQVVIERVGAAKSPAGLGDLRKMEGTKNSYRIRVGDYRIGIEIDGDTVEFVCCVNRRDIYREFP